MISEAFLNKGIVRTGAVIGVIGLAYVAGYYTKTQLGGEIGKIKDKISSAIVETITPEEHVRRNMPLYKKEIMGNQEKYKAHIVDIACFGVKEYPTDVFVKSVRSGVDYFKKEYNISK
jgi:hypothetical protein